jgi:hypothetical protein
VGYFYEFASDTEVNKLNEGYGCASLRYAVVLTNILASFSGDKPSSWCPNILAEVLGGFSMHLLALLSALRWLRMRNLKNTLH